MKTESGSVFIDLAAWGTLDPAERRDPKALLLLAIDFSPYDLPSAVRGGIDNASRKFVIEFRYVWPEKGTVTHACGDDHVEFVIGRVSRRLLEIHIDVENAGVDLLVLKSKAISAVSELSQTETRYKPTEMALAKFFADSCEQEARHY